MIQFVLNYEVMRIFILVENCIIVLQIVFEKCKFIKNFSGNNHRRVSTKKN